MTLRRDVAKALLAEGFRGEGGAYRRDIDDEWSLVVGVGPLNKRPDVTPQVGFRSEAVEMLSTLLRDLPESPCAATVGANVGYILDHDYQRYEPPAIVFDVLARIHMAFDVLRPYMELARIPEALKDIPAAAANPSTHYRLVVVQLLLEDQSGVLAALDEARAEYCRHEDEICRSFQHFRERVISRLNFA